MISTPAQGAYPPKAGGLRPWLMWGTCVLFFAFGFFVRVAPSIMVDDLMRDFAAGAAVVGNLSAIYFYAYAGMLLPAGLGLDRLGPRRMITAAAVVCGLGSLLFGIADGLVVAYAGRLLIGGGAAFAFIGALKLVAVWFPPRRFALLLGLTSAVGVGAGALAQGPLASILGMTGWRSIQITGSLFAFAIAAMIWMAVRDRPDQLAEPAVRWKVSGPGVFESLREVARNPQCWYPAIINAAVSGPLLVFGGLWGVSYLMAAYQLERPTAAFMASVMLLGHVAGSPFAGWVSDRIGRRKPIMLACVVLSLASFTALVHLPAQSWFVACALLFLGGVASGANTANYASAKEHTPAAFMATATGFLSMVTMATSAFLQYLVGWLLDLQWTGPVIDGVRVYTVASYQLSMTPLIVANAAAILAALAVRETYCRSVASR